jgi:hypothetical protein
MSHSSVSALAFEHRTSERIPLRTWCFVEARDRTYVVLTSDLSLGGLGLDGASGVRVGDSATVHVMLPDGGELRASVEVRHVKGKRIGVRWRAVSPELLAVYQSLADDEVTGVRRIVR